MATMRYDVIVVGGGASGLACVLTLASARGRGWEWAENRRYLVLDTGRSDMNRALFKNVPGVPAGTSGKDLLENLRRQVMEWGGVDFVQSRVISVRGRRGSFTVTTEDGREFTGEFVVLATGFHRFDIRCEGVEVVENPRSPKPGRVMIKHDGSILSEWAGSPVVVHDVPPED